MRTQSNDQQDVGATPTSSAGLVKRSPPLRFPGKKSAEDQVAEPQQPTPSTTSAAGTEAIPQVTTPSLLTSEMRLPLWRGNLTLFSGVTSTQPSESFADLGWPPFKQKLCPAEPTLVTDKKDAPYVLPCQLRDAPLTGKTLEHAEKMGKPTVGKMRSMDHVTESQVLIFDFDGIPASDFDRVRNVLEDQHLTYVAYTTHSHGLDDKAGLRVRLCIPINKPVDSAHYVRAWTATAKFLIDGIQKDNPAASMASVKLDSSGSKLYQQQGAWVCHPDRRSMAQRWDFDAGVLNIDALFKLDQRVESADAPTAPILNETLPTPTAATSDANLVTCRCNQIREFRDTKGANQSEPLWRDCLGVVGHCIDGRLLAHEWSQGHAGYSAKETDAKLDHRLRFGPTTCDQFRTTNPDGCDGCKENVKSPIMLGIRQSAPNASPPPQPDRSEPFDTVQPHAERVDLKQWRGGKV